MEDGEFDGEWEEMKYENRLNTLRFFDSTHSSVIIMKSKKKKIAYVGVFSSRWHSDDNETPFLASVRCTYTSDAWLKPKIRNNLPENQNIKRTTVFFDTDSDTHNLRIGRYQVPNQYQNVISTNSGQWF